MKQRPRLFKDEDLPPVPRQTRSKEKRERLTNAALELFGAYGYERASIEEIARRAGLATGTFYQHYRSKRQLLLALMDDFLEGMARLNLSPAPTGDVRGMLRGLLARGLATDRRYLGAYRAWQEAMLSDSALAADQVKVRQWTTERIAGLLKLLQLSPAARPIANVRALADVVDSLCWSLIAEAASTGKDQLNAKIDAVTDLIYHAVFRDRPAREHT
jgi:AcrR family transcriptional regulator